MNTQTQTGNLNNMTDAEYLAWLQENSIAEGIRPKATLAEYNSQKYNPVAPTPTDTAERTRFSKPGQNCGRGVVRVISPKQLKYMRFLLNSRNYRKLMDERWFRTLGATSHADLLVKIENISLRGARTMIDGLLTCPVRAHILEAEAESNAEPMATPPQLKYISGLLNEREHSLTVDLDHVTFAEARALIDQLNKCSRKVTPAKTFEQAKSVAGIYELDGEIYRMRKARNGNHFYAELLTNTETGAFEYAAGMAHKVPAQGRKFTLEEAEALSGIMGVCCCCSRELTATVDGVGPAARFIGPICSSKYF